jgi:hypothetical protein
MLYRWRRSRRTGCMELKLLTPAMPVISPLTIEGTLPHQVLYTSQFSGPIGKNRIFMSKHIEKKNSISGRHTYFHNRHSLGIAKTASMVLMGAPFDVPTSHNACLL